MTGVSIDRLEALYAETDDPWDFATSAYEQAKFAATRDALLRPRYRAALEIGCGNGALARHLAPRCDAYLGIDAVERPLETARRSLPAATFERMLLPGRLPEGEFDLIVLSEVLYFLSPPGLSALAEQIEARWPAAEILCVTWLGDSGNPLQGPEALSLFEAALAAPLTPVGATSDYRIDRRAGGRR